MDVNLVTKTAAVTLGRLKHGSCFVYSDGKKTWVSMTEGGNLPQGKVDQKEQLRLKLHGYAATIAQYVRTAIHRRNPHHSRYRTRRASNTDF